MMDPNCSATSGSSPRMRGKRGAGRWAPSSDQIIPAHAGQTRAHGAQRRAFPDHPRACGANTNRVYRLADLFGSSPRMRGKRCGASRMIASARIIPAHAGQTQPPRSSGGRATDHPRACGANSAQRFRQSMRAGSSPRMRGKRTTNAGMCSVPRIIPAHAGQTRFFRFFPGRPADHPRACGAN